MMKNIFSRRQKNFTAYHQPSIPWVNRLRRVMFLKGEMWKEKEEQYSFMTEIIHQAQDDPDMLEDK